MSNPGPKTNASQGPGYGWLVTWLTDPAEEWDDDGDAPRSHLKLIGVIVAGWLIVSLLVLAGLVLFKGSKSADTKSSAKPGASATQSASSQPPAQTLPDGWIQQAADDQTNCAAHAYGQVKDFFAKTPCTSVHRYLAITNQGGRQVVVAASTVTFPNPTKAKSYLDLVTSDGTGNINDLLREGTTVPGVGDQLPPAAFASKQTGSRVYVAEAAYASGHSDSSDATLKSLAQKAIDSV
jgi:hypothetical protein